ncbi:MAG: hypothetical protein AB8B89_08260 [Gammaproteobacteria bacterium]
MKNIVLYIVSLVFIANTLIASAELMLCMQQIEINDLQSEVLAESDMPCHDEQQNENDEHCKDACFCFIYSTGQTPFFELGNLNVLNMHQQRFIVIDEYANSKYFSSLYRPPIYIS